METLKNFAQQMGLSILTSCIILFSPGYSNAQCTVSVVGVNPSYMGACDGFAIATPTNGSPPYTYSWSTVPVQTTDIATNLCAGTYTVTITDLYYCTASASVVIVNPACSGNINPDEPCFWSTKGNTSATVSASSSLGTVQDNIPLRLVTTGTERIHINENTALTSGFVGIATSAPSTRLEVNGDLNLTNGSFDVYRLQGHRVLGWGTSSDITLVGRDAGGVNDLVTHEIPCGNDHTIVGFRAGFLMNHNGANCTIENTFVGANAGYSTNGNGGGSDGSYNTFIGAGAGYKNTLGHNNTMLGFHTGTYQEQHARNTFVGSEAGGGLNMDPNSDNNTFLGFIAAHDLNGGNNTVLGANAMVGNGYRGNDNALVGHAVQSGSVSISQCSSLGANTGFGFVPGGSIRNATAVGYGTIVCASNTMLFGNRDVIQWGFGICPRAGTVIDINPALTGGNVYMDNTGLWQHASDRNIKENIEKIDGVTLLEKIKKLDVTEWNYKNSPYRHIGPMAQDFWELFKLGHDDVTISSIDPAGVALAGIKQLINEKELLNQQLEANNSEMQALKDEMQAMKNKLNEFESALSQCCTEFENRLDNSGTNSEAPRLEQNIPNPFNQNTVIKYYVPQSATSASINIYSLDGAKLQSFSISQRGAGQIEISGNTLAPGTYVYHLLVNDKQIDGKLMTLTR